MSTPLYEGSCLCGGISFSMTAEPSDINNCFCFDCRKNAGGPFQTNAEWVEDDMTVNDHEKLENVWIITETASGSPKMKCFCKRCGCTLWTLFEVDGKVRRNVRVGLIVNGLERLQAKAEYFTKRRPARIPPVEGAVQYEEDVV